MAVSLQIFANNAESTLASALSTAATTISVNDATAFPNPGANQYATATLVRASDDAIEIVTYTGKTGNNLTGVTRAAEGTTALTFVSGDAVEVRVTEAALEGFLQISEDLSDLNNAATARSNLGISATNTPFTPAGSIVATDVQAAIEELDSENTTAHAGFQASDAQLDAISGLTPTGNSVIYWTGATTAAITTLTAAARTLIDDTTVAAMRATLGLEAGGAGDIWVEKAGDTMTGALVVNTSLGGSATDPDIAFGDGDSGFWEDADDDIHLSLLGAVQFRWVGSRYDVGGWGTESTGVNINGTTYGTGLRINDIGGSNPAQFMIHRHSTTLPAVLIASRSDTDDSTHGAVDASEQLFRIVACGYTGSHYDVFASIDFEVSDAGTISATSAPGIIKLKTTADGAQSATERIRIGEDGGIRFGAANAEVTTILDEDNMASDSATALATQQSIKAYVDAAGGGGGTGWTKISAQTLTGATTDTKVTFTLSSTYELFKLVILNIETQTDDKIILVRFSNDAGVSYREGASDYAWVKTHYGTSALNQNSTADSEIELIFHTAANHGLGTAGTETLSGELIIYDPTSSADETTVSHTVVYENAAGVLIGGTGWGRVLTAETNDAMEISLESDAAFSGKFILYGKDYSA